MLKKSAAPFFLFFLFSLLQAQPPKPQSAEIYTQIRKLNFLGSVLYVAAHPDDENTRLIAWLANDRKARTAYLSLTRGDGGQNLIGPELRELLGVIRTQELLEARKIDGGIQYFSRANDFGYSKNPTETLQMWDKQAVLEDMVRVIREFQPDVIINRFDARTPGTTHGHHTASAMLSLEAFELAARADAFPALKDDFQVWNANRLFMNTSWWFYGSREKFEKADKTNLLKIQTGTFYSEYGKSNQEIAALSRSSHKSQGFGSAGVRGQDEEYLELLKGSRPSGTDIFEGIDTTWNRVEGGAPIGQLIDKIAGEYDFRHPENSIPDLRRVYTLIANLKDGHWKTIKLNEVREVIASCAGLFLEATATVQQASPGDQVTLKIEAINRSNARVHLQSVMTNTKAGEFYRENLNSNQGFTKEISVTLPPNTPFTEPYWLVHKSTPGMYAVDDEKLIGKPESPRRLWVTFALDIAGEPMLFDREVIYKYTDDVRGEVYTPFDIVPPVTMTLPDKALIFTSGQARKFTVKVLAEKSGVQGKILLKADKGWKVEPSEVAFSSEKSRSLDLEFTVTPPAGASESELACIAVVGRDTLRSEKLSIDYPHIKRQLLFRESRSRLIKPEIIVGNQKIAYIMGAGDQVPASLRQMGYALTQLSAEEISSETLKRFDVVITGVRAYNMIAALALKQQQLLDFVNQGGTMIVQYNTLDELVTPDMSPYPLKLSRDRVTEENGKVSFIDPSDPVLNFPNKITQKDFEGWVQERGLYFPNEWDKAFRAVLSMKDSGESEKRGSLLVARYGKGTYIYTGLSFFRELPEGVSGAYRLMANLIASGKNELP